MSRNILPSAIEYLANTSRVRVAHLVTLELPGSTEEELIYDYLTDYSTEVEWEGKVFAPDRVVSVGEVRQGKGLTNYKVKVDIAGEYTFELDRALNDNKESSYVGKSIRIQRAYLRDDGTIIPFDKTTNGPMEYFFGNVSDISISDGIVSGATTVTWQCAGKFEDFDLVNGRVTDDASHRGLENIGGVLVPGSGVKRPEYAEDTGFQHANQTVNLISKYTTTEKRYKMKSSFFGLKSKLKEYEVEVEKELELGVDLSAKYLPYVRGVRKVPGIPVFLDTSNNNPSHLFIVYALCEGPASLLNLYIDGESTICLDSSQEDTDMCLGNQKNGDTLSKFMRADSGYENLHNSYSPKPVADVYSSAATIQDRPNYSLPPTIPQSNTEDPTKGITDPTEFTITNSTGVKRLAYFPGTSDQAAYAKFVSIAANGGFRVQAESGRGSDYWDSDSKLLNTAYLVLEMEITEENQEIPEIEAVVESFGRSGNSPIRTLNPVDHLYDYITNSVVGGGLKPSEVDTVSFDYVRAIYDAELNSYENSWVDYWRYLGWSSSSGHVKRLLECNTLLNTDETVTKNIESLLEQMDATINQLGGKYHLSVEDSSTPIADINSDDFIGNVTVKDTSNKGKWNAISANLIDPALDWTANKLVFFDSEYLAQDKNDQKKGNVTFPYVTNYYVARNWAKRQLDRSRFSKEITIKTYFKYIYLYPNANITVTYDKFGWDKELFRVKTMVMHTDGLVTLTLEDTSTSIYDDIDDSYTDNPPIPSGNIQPPQDFKWVAASTEEFNLPDLENVYGFLVWKTYAGENLLRYELEDWNNPGLYEFNIVVPYNRTVQHNVSGEYYVYHPLTSVEFGETYTFRARVIDRFGNYSRYSLFNLTITSDNLPESYSMVTGFRAINVDDEFDYIGNTVTFVWDLHPSDEINLYQLAIRPNGSSEDKLYFILDTRDQDDCTFTFDISTNMQLYQEREGSLGAYRGYIAGIKPIPNDGTLIDYTYI